MSYFIFIHVCWVWNVLLVCPSCVLVSITRWLHWQLPILFSSTAPFSDCTYLQQALLSMKTSFSIGIHWIMLSFLSEVTIHTYLLIQYPCNVCELPVENTVVTDWLGRVYNPISMVLAMWVCMLWAQERLFKAPTPEARQVTGDMKFTNTQGAF